MILAHVMGMPVEEGALALAPAGAAILTGVTVIARSKLAQIGGRLRRRGDGAQPPVPHPPTLITWGNGDEIFAPAGAEAYTRDLPNR